MPNFDVRCEQHGVNETFCKISEAPPRLCPICGGPASMVFDTVSGYARIDAMSEVNAHNPDPQSRGINRGLPLVKESLGRDLAGKEHFRWRAMTSAEVGSNANARRIAREHGLIPKDSGAYRTTPR